jgi:PadR family transcriptional regulator PadR
MERRPSGRSASWIASCQYLVVQGTMCHVVGAGEELSQLRRGTLEFCVLALLADEERYGFDIVRTLGSIDGMVTGEGTLYPLLSRLKKAGHVSTRWRESDAGPPRKYYAITAEGRRALSAFTAEWRRFSAAVDSMLSKGAQG